MSTFVVGAQDMCESKNDGISLGLLGLTFCLILAHFELKNNGIGPRHPRSHFL